eukprot:1704684-Amphidinium_carterae.1
MKDKVEGGASTAVLQQVSLRDDCDYLGHKLTQNPRRKESLKQKTPLKSIIDRQSEGFGHMR